MHQYSQGKHTTQAHKGIPDSCFEEEQGRRGFFGQVSHIIKPQPSTRWTQIDGPLRPHLYDLVKLAKNEGEFQRLTYNSDVVVYTLNLGSKQKIQNYAFRDADGDLLYFCHYGEGKVLTEYGLLKYKKGSYISLPKCCHHNFFCESESQFLVIESRSGSYREPDRGMVGRNAFYDLTALGKPDLEEMHSFMKTLSINIKEIHVKRLDVLTRFTYSENIYDTLGWKGDFFPFTLHISDLMPMLSARVHLPPSAHTTFVANGFVVCTFLPRPLESDTDALKVPFYHQNIDYDEILFYHDGDFFSRDNLHAGMMTIHPAGFPHGPHPKAIQGSKTKTHTDEVAVMIDTWQALNFEPRLENVEVMEYWKSWMKT